MPEDVTEAGERPGQVPAAEPGEARRPARGAARTRMRMRWPRRRSERPRPTRRRKWARRLLTTVLVLIVTATLFSVGYNAATAGRAREPDGLRFVSADGIRTRYLQWGGGGPPVVLVHGAAESADTWNRVAGLLAAHRRVYALDLTGWGYSRRRGPYDAEHERRSSSASSTPCTWTASRSWDIPRARRSPPPPRCGLPVAWAAWCSSMGTDWTPVPAPTRVTCSACSPTRTGRPCYGSPSGRTG